MTGQRSCHSNLLFVGDIALGNHPKKPGFGFYSKYRGGIPLEKASHIFPPVTSADLIFGNLEFVLANDQKDFESISTCIGNLSFISFLKKCGFTVLNVANNHAFDYGPEIFNKMIENLHVAGIKVVGTPEDFESSEFIHKNGKKICFLGCALHPQMGPEEKKNLNIFDRCFFLQRIRQMKKCADIVCVSIHWGEEFVPIPSTEERKIAREIIDAGASIVVGHHPHVLREIECYKGGIIAYSLGNFIGDMTWNQFTRETGCLMVGFKNRKIYYDYFFPARIGSDYFPKYLPHSSHKLSLSKHEKECLRWKKALKTTSYRNLSRKALIKNQLYTFFFVLKNLHKYNLHTLKKLIIHGIRVRLPQKNKVR